MSEQHPAVAHLLAAHEQAMDLADAAEQGDCEGIWWATEHRHFDDGKIRVVKTQNPYPGDPDPTYWLAATWIVTGDDNPEPVEEANLRHIALHDPASVRRRIAADRRILAEHQPERTASVPVHATCRDLSCDCYEDIATCGACAPGHYYDADPQPWPCATVLDLAAGWGWEAGQYG